MAILFYETVHMNYSMSCKCTFHEDSFVIQFYTYNLRQVDTFQKENPETPFF